MTQYISKSALVTEMIRKMNRCKKILLDIRTRQNKDYYQGKSEAYKEMISFLSTLEMNEVDAIHPIDDVVSNDPIANTLEISRHGNSHNGETLEEAAENYPSIIRTISPQWESEIERAFIAGAQWQKKQAIEKTCKWLEDNVDHYAYNKDFVPNAKERFIKMFRRAEI